MPMPRILIIGGYGAFGFMAARRLAKTRNIEIVIAGRNAERAHQIANDLQGHAKTQARVTATPFDATSCKPQDISEISPKVVINASGPFQFQNYHLAETCIKAGTNYIDIADSRDYVCAITTLNDAARSAGVAVISGASSLPGLSSAVVAHYRSEFPRPTAIHIGLSPGNRFEHGIATTRSVLSYVGKPITMPIGGTNQPVYGWQNLERHNFPTIGSRWLGNAEVPDLDLFTKSEPNLQTVTFKAGVELGFVHLGLWALSGLVRSGLISSLEPSAKLLRNLNRMLSHFGSDKGGMFVTLSGPGEMSKMRQLTWTLIADSGHGPYVPIIAPVILAKHIVQGKAPRSGARPCFEEISLKEFTDEVADLDITFHYTEASTLANEERDRA